MIGFYILASIIVVCTTLVIHRHYDYLETKLQYGLVDNDQIEILEIAQNLANDPEMYDEDEDYDGRESQR